jgi:hypothetical protein
MSTFLLSTLQRRLHMGCAHKPLQKAVKSIATRARLREMANICAASAQRANAVTAYV